MDELRFSFENSLVSESELSEVNEVLEQEIENMIEATNHGYDDDRASINLPVDQEAMVNVKKLITEKSKLAPRFIVVVGIGGSNLGTIAVQEAVLGKLFNQLEPKIKILYAETVDSDLMDNILRIIEPILQNGENVLINGVSKSGSTTETIANFEIFIDLLKKYKDDYERFVVVTTDKDSKFWNLAEENGFSKLEIPKKVGGRYSVLSPVGLFPLGLIGVDIENLQQGAIKMRKRCLNKNILENPAAMSSGILFLHNKLKAKNIHDLFLFGPDLEGLGKWYRQLTGESVGKEFDRTRKQVFSGITPTVSVGSTDLHSVAQLYLGGPIDKVTSFVSVDNSKSDISIPSMDEYSKLVANIQGRPLPEILDAILQGVKAAYTKNSRPYMEVELPDKSEGSIGQFLQFKMMEIMYLGALLGVNPFDQPNVESYKAETRRILAED